MATMMNLSSHTSASRALSRSQSLPCQLRVCSSRRVVPQAFAGQVFSTRRCSAAGSRSNVSHQHRSRKQVITRASWGAPVDFSTAKVVSNQVAAPGMHQVLVDVGSSIASGYTKAGQYIQAKVTADAKPGFFAIASGPDPNNQGVLELLIKVQPGATAEAICVLQPGAELLVSPVQGKGFPIDRIPAADYPTVLMFATGSGISPIKAVIESDALEVAKRQEVRLYYGTKSPENTAYQSVLSDWIKQGLKVTQVYSGGDKKYVQHVFAEEAAHITGDPKKVAVLLCGQKGMCESVTEVLKSHGVEKEQILMNF